MHELSIAMGIVDLVESEQERFGGRRVETVHVKLGRLSGVVEETLQSSFAMAIEDTPLAGSRLCIEHVPIRVRCEQCGAPRLIRSDLDFRCIACGTPSADVVPGRELMVVALELQPASTFEQARTS
jgi:hydrogenase nickel incorporation protein HypA/HybF